MLDPEAFRLKDSRNRGVRARSSAARSLAVGRGLRQPAKVTGRHLIVVVG